MCMNLRSLFMIPVWAVAILASCTEREYKILDDGVVVNVREPADGGPQKVRLTVMSDHIVRVTATPDKTFHDRSSLIILPDANQDAGFVVRNHKDEVVLQPVRKA